MKIKEKLLFIFAIVISNTFTYLLFFSPGQESTKINNKIIRQGYQKVNLKVFIKTPLTPGLPITISSLNYKTLIRDVFYLQTSGGVEDNFSADFSQTTEITVELPSSQAEKALRMKSILVLPHDFKTKPTQRKISYEITY